MNNETKNRTRRMFSLTCGTIAQAFVENPFVVYHQLRMKRGTSGIFQTFRVNPDKILAGFCVRFPGNILRKSCENYAFVNSPFKSGYFPAIFSAICSSPIICPLKVIEKRKRAGASVKDSMLSPLTMFRGLNLVALHSCISVSLRLVEQPRLKKSLCSFPLSGILSSLIVSFAYILMTNPLSRLEIIMQTSPINKSSIKVEEAIEVVMRDIKANGYRGMFRGQGTALCGATISLFVFHEVSEMIFSYEKTRL